jgi:hypothetical protein
MNWYRADPNLEHDPRFLALIAARGWRPATGLGYIHRLLSAVRNYAPDGDISSWGESSLANMMGLTRGRRGLLHDLIEHGFVVAEGERTLVAGWSETNGRWLKDAERKRRERSGRSQSEAAHPDDSRAPSEARPRLDSSTRTSQGVPPESPQTVQGHAADGPRSVRSYTQTHTNKQKAYAPRGARSIQPPRGTAATANGNAIPGNHAYADPDVAADSMRRVTEMLGGMSRRNGGATDA